jgi:hypothetical protein
MFCCRTGSSLAQCNALHIQRLSTDLEVSGTASILLKQAQNICSGPRLATTQIIKGEEELEATTIRFGCLKCKILLVKSDKQLGHGSGSRIIAVYHLRSRSALQRRCDVQSKGIYAFAGCELDVGTPIVCCISAIISDLDLSAVLFLCWKADT